MFVFYHFTVGFKGVNEVYGGWQLVFFWTGKPLGPLIFIIGGNAQVLYPESKESIAFR